MRKSIQFLMWMLPLLLLAWSFVSCHSLPSPGLLPKNVWKYSILPYMRILMGIHGEIQNLPQPLTNYVILRFPTIYGTSSFDMADMDGDQDMASVALYPDVKIGH